MNVALCRFVALRTRLVRDDDRQDAETPARSERLCVECERTQTSTGRDRAATTARVSDSSFLMTLRPLVHVSAVVCLFAAPTASAAEYYVASPTSNPAGNDSGAGSLAAPFKTIGKGVGVVKAGDTVYLRGGTYNEAIYPSASGAPNAWITFSAYPGELPILSGAGVSSSTAQYIRIVGIAVRGSSFGNGWVNDVGTSNGNWQFINCIADGGAINGIAFYNASGVLIDESIVAHNGNQMPSWSSGVNLYHVGGDYTTNIVRRTVSFENIDISPNHTDGSGFILDQNSSGALFENNIGFRNGGSCIRINCPGARIINNTCYHDGLAPADLNPTNPGEIYFSNGPNGAVFVNNLAAASGWNNTMTAYVNGPVGSSNFAVNMNGPTPFFMNPGAVDFSLVAGSTMVIDKGTSVNAPSTDIGFDSRCIVRQTGQAVPWWNYAIDYPYIATIGGVASCFHPSPRPQGVGPDIGAFEFGGQLADGGTSSSSGGSSGSSSGGSGGGADATSESGSSGGSSGSDGGSGGGPGPGLDAGPSSGASSDANRRPETDGGDAGKLETPGGARGCACGVAERSDGSWAWLLAGLGLLGVGARRKRRSPVQ